MFFAQGPLDLFILACVLAAGKSAANPAARLQGGQTVDNRRLFAHHVYIISPDSKCKCCGSILNSRWVLTSAVCVKDCIRLELHFGKQHEFNINGDYFAVSVNKDQVFVYPTNHDDLALIKIPVGLVYSENIAPVNISRSSSSPQSLFNRFAVMPGFEDEPVYADEEFATRGSTRNDSLKYGMFQILDSGVCKKSLTSFDEYTQLCTVGWGDNPNTQCTSDYGSGLIVGWPAKSELVGLFSVFSPTCSNKVPGVYTFVGKYLSWIESMIQG